MRFLSLTPVFVLGVICVSCIVLLQSLSVRWDAEERVRQMGKREKALNEQEEQLRPFLPLIDSLPGMSALKETGYDSMPTLYIITPTYKRLMQLAELTRMCYTLKMVPKLHWIVVEDSSTNHTTPRVANLLARCGIPYSHMAVGTPAHLKRTICKTVNPRQGCPQHLLGKEAQMWTKARGVMQRNKGLDEVIRLTKENESSNAVVYFADDDNTYSLELFEEIRTTKKVSVWLVAFSGGVSYEGPIVKGGVVTDWHVAWRPDRPFPVDMAGFAVHANEILENPDIRFDDKAERGFLESRFLQSIGATKATLEPKGLDCNCALVWHTRSEIPVIKHDQELTPNPKVVL